MGTLQIEHEVHPVGQNAAAQHVVHSVRRHRIGARCLVTVGRAGLEPRKDQCGHRTTLTQYLRLLYRSTRIFTAQAGDHRKKFVR
ncbi:Uncharacterised protein [Mycobacteroides abscessus subsp. massiliense]|nr:Uncharacterised protein [Mycobacteroides abscessus subsp. massiliense]